jgi:hypothetical protein
MATNYLKLATNYLKLVTEKAALLGLEPRTLWLTATRSTN